MSDSDDFFEAPPPPRRKKARKKAAKLPPAVPSAPAALGVGPGLGAGGDAELCVVCSCSTRGWTIMDHQVHLNECLDRHSGGVSASAGVSASRVSGTSASAGATSAAVACPICAKSIGRLTLARREEHINRCLDTARAAGGRSAPAAARRARPAVHPGLVCFMCGKSLARMARGSQTTHLKTCAQQRGVSTADLIAWRRSVDAPPSAAGGGGGGGGGGRRRRRSTAAPKQRRSATRTKAVNAARLFAGRGADEIRKRIGELDTEIATRAALRTELLSALAQKEREAHDAARNARNAPLTLADAIAAAGFSPPASPRGGARLAGGEGAAGAAEAGGAATLSRAESSARGRRATGLSRTESGLSAWAMAGAGDVLDGVALSQTKFQTKFDSAALTDDDSSASSDVGDGDANGDADDGAGEGAASVEASAVGASEAEAEAAAAGADAARESSEGSASEMLLDALVDALTQTPPAEEEEKRGEGAAARFAAAAAHDEEL